jgi:hypothetical protein
MNTKHKPATPLPLEAVPHRDPDEGDPMAVVYCDTFEQAVQTADYITRAANAYPQLIEALRDVLRQVKAYEGQHDNLRALLHELGEGS